MLNIFLSLLLLSSIHHSNGSKQCVMRSIDQEPTQEPTQPPTQTGRMTNRFPLACKSKYSSPYTFIPIESGLNELCFEFEKTDCKGGISEKCLQIQNNLRKMMISTLQDPICGAKQLYKDGPYSGSAREYSVLLKDPNGNKIIGASIVYFWHTWLNETETAMELYVPQGDMGGYSICISGDNTRKCFLNKNAKMCISTYDVSDHSCDNCNQFDCSQI